MEPLVGKVDYLNCFPIYYPLEQGIISFPTPIIKGPPAELNKKYLKGELIITPISSIEYARNPGNSLILPDLSISAQNKVESILLFSKIPIEELSNCKIALTNSSATSIVLLKILLKNLFQVEPDYQIMFPALPVMMKNADAALLIGDDALNNADNRENYFLYDLGELWFKLTGLPMVFALWVINKNFVQSNLLLAEEIKTSFLAAKQWQINHTEILVKEACHIYEYSTTVINNYFSTIKYDLSSPYEKALRKFYDYAMDIDEISDKVELDFWR